MFKKFDKNDKYRKIALWTLFVGIVLIALIFIGMRIPEISAYVKGFLEALSSFAYGFVFAFLLNPIYKKFRKYVFKFVERKKPHPKLRKALALISTYIVAAGLIAILLLIVLPNLIDNIKSLIEFLPGNIERLRVAIVELLGKIPYIEDPNAIFQQTIAAIFGTNGDLGDLSGTISTIVSYVFSLGESLVNLVVSVIVGLVLSVYMLIYKGTIIRQLKRFLCAIFSKKTYTVITDFAKYSNNTFGRYIIGTIIDSILVGIVTGVICALCQFPYAPLIGVICGVTNVIPFFGPFIGAIPSALLILIDTWDIWKVLLFALIILIIQQIDGNLIAPHIHGASTGLSPIGVIFATTAFSYFFGFIGMVIGVPVCAIISYAFSLLIKKRLRDKKLPDDLNLYEATDIYSDEKFKQACQDILDKERKEKEEAIKPDESEAAASEPSLTEEASNDTTTEEAKDDATVGNSSEEIVSEATNTENDSSVEKTKNISINVTVRKFDDK